MLLKETVVDVVDNSNIIKAKIISHRGLYAFVSSIVYIARKKLRKGTKLLEKKKYGLVVGSRFGVRRLSGVKLIHSKNSIIILQDSITPLSSRFSGCFFLEVKSFFSAKPLISLKYFV
jgi:ribosomal protein L14